VGLCFVVVKTLDGVGELTKCIGGSTPHAQKVKTAFVNLIHLTQDKNRKRL